jgi:hypothetical protein
MIRDHPEMTSEALCMRKRRWRRRAGLGICILTAAMQHLRRLHALVAACGAATGCAPAA